MMTLFVLSQMILLAYLVNFIVCSFKYNNGTYLLGWYAYFSFGKSLQCILKYEYQD
jgi:hypothetical protein